MTVTATAAAAQQVFLPRSLTQNRLRVAMCGSSTQFREHPSIQVNTANKVTRTGWSLAVQSANTKFHVGSIVELGAVESQFRTRGPVTAVDGTGFTIAASLPGADGPNAQALDVMHLAQFSSCGVLHRALWRPDLAGGFVFVGNVSKGGNDTTSTLDRLPWILACDADIYVGAFGLGNDLLVNNPDVATSKANINTIVSAITGAGKTMILYDVPPGDQSFGAVTTAQKDAIKEINFFVRQLELNNPRVIIARVFDRMILATDVNGNSQPGLYESFPHVNCAGAIVQADIIADCLARARGSVRYNPLRTGRFEYSSTYNGVGCNLSDAGWSASGVSASTLDALASGTIDSQYTIAGTGTGRTAVCSLFAVPDGSYGQRILFGGNAARAWQMRDEGPSGRRYKDSMVAGGWYQYACDFSISGMNNLQAWQCIVEATIGGYTGNLAAPMSYEGSIEQNQPTLCAPTHTEGGVICSQPFYLPATATMVGVKWDIAHGGPSSTADLRIMHSTMRRLA